MQNFLKSLAAFLVCSMLLPIAAQAQFQVNVMGSRWMSVESGNFGGVWGTGATLRYFISPRVAVGLNARYFSANNSYSSGNFSSSSRFTYLITTGQAEYFFAESGVRPYVGLEAGLYTGTYKAEFTGATVDNFSGTSHYFGAAPKAGLQFPITPFFGLNAEASYQLQFGQYGIGQSLLLNAGAYVNFGRR